MLFYDFHNDVSQAKGPFIILDLCLAKGGRADNPHYIKRNLTTCAKARLTSLNSEGGGRGSMIQNNSSLRPTVSFANTAYKLRFPITVEVFVAQ